MNTLDDQPRFGPGDRALAELPTVYRSDLFAGKVVLVSGAGSGIGKAIAFLYARLGATLAICGRKADALELCAEQLRSLGGGREVLAFPMSIRDPEQVEALFEAVWQRFGGLDVLVNNAGIGFGHNRHKREVSADGIELRLAINYLAPFVLTHELTLRSLPTRAIVNLASIGQQELDFDDLLAERSYDGITAYRRSKLALIAWTFDLAAAHPKLGCLALHPGTLLDTAMVRDAGLTPQGPVQHGGENTCLVIERALSGLTGRYFDQQHEAHALPQAYDPAARARLRELTLALVEPFLTQPAAVKS